MSIPTPDMENGASANQSEAQNEAQRKLHDLLESMWEQRKGMVVERLNTLTDAVQHLKENATPASREKGIYAAHNLAGILGTFGIPQGTELAREVEVAMGTDGPLSETQIQHLQNVIGQLTSLIAQRSLPTAR
jgi:HPt (histidine-containing phosphotransfer) domain-containing protein